ncbi:hypothetical protein EKK58_09930 [Candidatus Dependentiae bacterium]|nr:MAG: hypothetical protein EKK58_09930 [Candidatus Dependentiae bacterium]
MLITNDNYYSIETNKEYLSVSQFKDFAGTIGIKGCESKALAKINGEWVDKTTTAMLIGAYIDAHFSGTLNIFKAKNPEIFKKDGELKAEFIKANDVIKRIERDEYFMQFLQGDNQNIFTGELFGAKWKCKLDFINQYAISDLKVMANIRDMFWIKDFGHVSWVTYWGYDIQAAVYQRIVEINTNKRLPFFIACASKEEYPDIEILGFTQQDLDNVLYQLPEKVKRILDIKEGLIEPIRCETCDYCRHTKVLTQPIHFNDIRSDI